MAKSTFDLELASEINACSESIALSLSSDASKGCFQCSINESLVGINLKCSLIDQFLNQMQDKQDAFTYMTSEPKTTEECLEDETQIPKRLRNTIKQRSPRSNRHLYAPTESAWKTEDHKVRCESINKIINGVPINQCQLTHCVTAPFYAILKHIKHRPDFDKCLKQHFICTPPKKLGDAYHVFNGYYGLETLMTNYGLGEYQDYRLDKIEENADTFKPGSPIFFQKTKKYSYGGHSGIFDRFLYKNGKPSHLCFWSSNMWNKEFTQAEDTVQAGKSKKGGVNTTCFELDKEKFLYVGLGTFHE